MTPSTAIIIHPAAPAKPRGHHHPQSRRLEQEGPWPFFPSVNLWPGKFLRGKGIEHDSHREDMPWRDQRAPVELMEADDEPHHALRCIRLLRTLQTTDERAAEVLHEIRLRLICMHPCCRYER